MARAQRDPDGVEDQRLGAGAHLGGDVIKGQIDREFCQLMGDGDHVEDPFKAERQAYGGHRMASNRRPSHP